MFLSCIFSLFLLLLLRQVQASSPYWSTQAQGVPWQWQTPYQSDSFFDDFVNGVSNMQTTYWNGTYWPTTIQWIGAFLDTLLPASDESLTSALVESNGQPPGSHTSRGEISSDILAHYNDTAAYYYNEDVVQIFGAAYDDAQWVVLEWIQVIEFLNKYQNETGNTLATQEDISNYAHRAQVFYNRVQNQFNTTLCGGGLTWNPALAVYKNAITNELFLSSSMAMYLYWPGNSNPDPYPTANYAKTTNTTLPPMRQLHRHDQFFLNNAIEEWNWFKGQNFLNDQGLVVDGFHISADQTTCDQRNDMVYSYNMGVLLSGLRGLWEATGDTSYLDEGYGFIESAINATGWNAQSASEASQWSGLGQNGILADYCDAPANCSQDNLMFKGIYFHHLEIFIEPLPTTTAKVPGVTKLASSNLASQHVARCAKYAPWIQHNARAALATRNDAGIFGNWWGAPYVNETQAPAPQYASPLPTGSLDYRNNPQILQQGIFQCLGKPGCGFPLTGRGLHARSDNVRTVETQAGGVSVVKAASDVGMWNEG